MSMSNVLLGTLISLGIATGLAAIVVIISVTFNGAAQAIIDYRQRRKAARDAEIFKARLGRQMWQTQQERRMYALIEQNQIMRDALTAIKNSGCDLHDRCACHVLDMLNSVDEVIVEESK